MTELEISEVTEPEFMFCNACMGSTDPSYQTYNLMVSGVLLALVGLVGLCGNFMVVRVYLHREQRVHSTSIYLAALAFSDFFLILTAMFLFVLEAWRHHNYPTLAYWYVSGAPIIFPIAAVFQTTSVYFCVAAAVDCFIAVVLPESVRVLYCKPSKAKYTCTCIMAICIVYNIPHFFELDQVPCISNEGKLSTQICPSGLRMDPAYYAIYYTYMYTTFLAIGPLTLLILLNICVVYCVLTNNSNSEESDTVSLILVVFFFIFCNFMALLVNFMELVFDNPRYLVYLVDLSNLLVVINGTANFFCYLTFGASFRKTLKKVIFGEDKSRKRNGWLETTSGKIPEAHHSLL